MFFDEWKKDRGILLRWDKLVYHPQTGYRGVRGDER